MRKIVKELLNSEIEENSSPQFVSTKKEGPDAVSRIQYRVKASHIVAAVSSGGVITSCSGA
jgi:hypothetical protein